MSAGIDVPVRSADVVVVGGGQAGLSAAYHLQRRGLVPAGTVPEGFDQSGGRARNYTSSTPRTAPEEPGATAGRAFAWPP